MREMDEFRVLRCKEKQDEEEKLREEDKWENEQEWKATEYEEEKEREEEELKYDKKLREKELYKARQYEEEKLKEEEEYLEWEALGDWGRKFYNSLRSHFNELPKNLRLLINLRILDVIKFSSLLEIQTENRFWSTSECSKSNLIPYSYPIVEIKLKSKLIEFKSKDQEMELKEKTL